MLGYRDMSTSRAHANAAFHLVHDSAADSAPVAQRRRDRSQRELATLDEADRHDLGHSKNFPTDQDDEDGHRHRMLENLVAVAWIATLMASAYYVFSQLTAVS